jgi:SAM-dependent methyltransferase
MSDSPAIPPKIDDKDQFQTLLRSSLEQNTFVKLVLGKYRGPEADLMRILVRRITVKNQNCLCLTTCYKTREMAKNVPIESGIETIAGLLGAPFLSASLFTLTEDVQLEFSKKGKCTWGRSKPSHNAPASEQHDHDKERLLDPASPFLAALGVTDAQQRIIPSKARKWKQINRFLEIFQHALASSRIAQAKEVHVVDFGSGKAYLTFAIHDLLRNTHAIKAQVTGIELREDLVQFCNGAATRLALDGLRFYQGDVSSYAPESLHIMIALHACDTATDQAIYLGIRTGAEIIMSAPCCHKQIRPQMRSPEVMEPMLRFGVHLGQEAEMVTDSLRALLLEAHGYTTQLLEFVSLEHTSKNKMLLAVKHGAPVDRARLLAKVQHLKDFYGIREHCLETLLCKG